MSKNRFFSKSPSTTAGKSTLYGSNRKKGVPFISRMSELETLLELHTSYSADTVYRLRYEDMTYDYISPSVTRLLGFTPQEMKKVNFRTLILETRLVTDGMKTVSSFEELEQKRREGDVSKWQADYQIRTKDEREIWVSDISYPWFDDHGKVIGSVGSLRDVTDRVMIEQEIQDKIETIATVDALTGMMNRREFFGMLERELRLMHRTANDVSILLVDVDQLKDLAVVYGLDIRDYLIVEIGKIVKSALRDTDVVARLDGGQFAVILPDTPKEGAYWVAERIRSEVLKHSFETGADSEPTNCTVCVGVASALPGVETTATELFKTADTRLYIAKNTGRNQVSVDEILQTH